MAGINEGTKAPEFKLADSEGKRVSLSDFRGRIVVLYFYPKDDTPGCTIEACSFRDNYSTLKKDGIAVLGVSRDDLVSHQKFTKKYSLPFPLLSDTGGTVSKRYGVLVEKMFFGKKVVGIKRTTFLIGKDGKILKVIGKVDVLHHADQIMKELTGLGVI